ncbi:MAG TPA: multiprotein bridging factor aMBF1 [Methanolinea sp.]|nr:multiprotein bridging factor aMBF1 [Methanolinea sp.]
MSIKMFATSMQCELCGGKIVGPSKTVRVEGAELVVCANCARYGTEVQMTARAQPRAGTGPRAGRSVPVRRSKDVFDLIEGEIVEDYGERIRAARMERGLSQKDLAMQLKEKELLIKKIEKGDLIPEDEVRRKLEKALGIRLIDSPADDEGKRGGGTVVPTLGDVISIKKVHK